MKVAPEKEIGAVAEVAAVEAAVVGGAAAVAVAGAEHAAVDRCAVVPV